LHCSCSSEIMAGVFTSSADGGITMKRLLW
jgi:hypothetical protein